MIFLSKRSSIKSFLSNASLNPRTEHYLLSYLIAFLLHYGRMSATQASRSLKFSRRHKANAARFLASVGWSNNWYHCYRDATLLLEAEWKRGDLFVFMLDQTCCSHQGDKTENTFSTGNRLRRPCKGRRYGKKRYTPRRVHAFVMGLLITPSGLRLPVNKCYFTKDYAAKHQIQYKTQADLGAELITELHVPVNARVIVLGDTAYDAKQIRQACQKRDFWWIVPMNTERVLDGKTREQRLKVRSVMQAKQPEQFTPIRLQPTRGKHATQRRLSKCRKESKKQGRTFYVHSEILAVQSVGTVRVVASCKDKPITGEPLKLTKVLMTNDQQLKERQVVELYSLRWQIELFFKELKSSLGLHQYNFRDFKKVAGWVELALLTFVYLEWQRAKKLRDGRVQPEKRCWWEQQRTHGAMQAARDELDKQELEELTRLASTKTGIKQLRQLLRKAAPSTTLSAA